MYAHENDVFLYTRDLNFRDATLFKQVSSGKNILFTEHKFSLRNRHTTRVTFFSHTTSRGVSFCWLNVAAICKLEAAISLEQTHNQGQMETKVHSKLEQIEHIAKQKFAPCIAVNLHLTVLPFTGTT